MIGQRIKALLKEKNFRQNSFARQIGVTEMSLSNWILGKSEPSLSTIQKIADALGISPAALIGSPSAPVGWIKIPVIGRVPAGVPLEAVEDFDGEIVVPQGEFSADRHLALRVFGDSMKPRFIEGDAVIVDTQDREPPNGSVVVIRVNGDGEITLKKFYRQGDLVILQAENPKFPPLTLTPNSEIRVVGSVVGMYRSKP